MQKKYIFSFLGAALAATVAVMLSSAPKTPVSEKLQVAAGIYPLAFFAEQIGGDNVDVFTVTPPGVEPHEYEASARDIARIEDSRVLLLNGLGMEPWGSNVSKNLDPGKTRFVVVSAGLPTVGGDPHVWLSPTLAQSIVDTIANVFGEIDPENAAEYRANASTIKNILKSLDREYENGLAACARRSFITSHSAFGYLATKYRLDQVPIAGLSPDAEPSPQDLARIALFAKAKNIKYIFFESLASPKLSDTLAREVGASTLVLNPIEGITPAEASEGKNYFTEMRANLINLRTALECN